MTHLYRALLNQMGQKIAIYRELIDILKREWDCIVAYSLEDLQAILKGKEMLTLKLQVLEENRIKVITEIGKKLNINSENLTLKNILKAHNHSLNPKLAAHRKVLLEQIDTLKEYTLKTQGLVDRSSLSIKKSIVFLHRSLDKAAAPYGADGQMGVGKSECHMLNAEV